MDGAFFDESDMYLQSLPLEIIYDDPLPLQHGKLLLKHLEVQNFVDWWQLLLHWFLCDCWRPLSHLPLLTSLRLQNQSYVGKTQKEKDLMNFVFITMLVKDCDLRRIQNLLWDTVMAILMARPHFGLEIKHYLQILINSELIFRNNLKFQHSVWQPLTQISSFLQSLWNGLMFSFFFVDTPSCGYVRKSV